VTLPLLVTLANKSWLTYDLERDRYNVHELMRQYGANKLAFDAAHESRVRFRHSAYHCRFLKAREADWFGARQKEAASEVQDEIENIQTAWLWAINHKDYGLLDLGLNSLCRFFLWEGRMTDGRNACRSAGEGLSRSLAEADNSKHLALWSRVLAWESEFVNEVEQKKELLSQSQQLLDRIAPTGRDTRAEQAFIFLEKAYVMRNRDYEEAIRFGNLGRELFRDLDDRWGEAETLGLLGANYHFRGAFDRAHELLHESLKIRKQLEDTQGIAESMLYLGLVAQQQGRYEEAESLHRQSLGLYKQLGNRFHEGWCLNVLSFTLSWAGKFTAARKAAARASALHRDLGQSPSPWSFIASTIATIHLGRYTEARAIASEGLKTARQRGHLAETGFALMYLGNAALVEGDLIGAKRYLLESAAVLAELRHVNRGLPQAILSYVVRAQGKTKLAHEYLVSALRLGIELHSIRTIKFILPAAALLAADDGHTGRAIELSSLAQQFAHTTNSSWFEAIAFRELEDVRASLVPDVTSVVEARVQNLDLWVAAEELLLELTSHS
jgi:tetratricopeptide (TPR) repeat protein